MAPAGATAGAPLPFRRFFLAAALYASVPVAVWLPASLGGRIGPIGATPLPLWHAQELLFGMMPAAMAGFLLTAVPRWTGRALAAPRAVALLLPLWLAGRIGAFAAPAAGAALTVAFLLLLAAIVAGSIAAARDQADAGPAVLVVLFALAGTIVRTDTADAAAVAFGLRLGLAAVLALHMILAGRIIPALTAYYVRLQTGAALRLRHRTIERLSGGLAAAALAAWVAAPAQPPTLVLCLLAAVAHMVRLAGWQGWRVRRAAPVLALHVAYAWLPAGFLLLAWHIARPARLGELAAVHAWAVGGIAVLCLGIMSSMIRRHTGQAFVGSPVATACYASGLLAAVARLLAELAPAWRGATLLAAILLWIACYGLFLRGFGGALVPRRWPRSGAAIR